MKITKIGPKSGLRGTKGHARWVLPSLDVDEFLSVPYQGGLAKLFDSIMKRQPMMVHSLVLQKYRFARAPAGELEITSTRRSRVAEPGHKYVFAPQVTHALGAEALKERPLRGLCIYIYILI